MERIELPDGLVYYRSSRLHEAGVPHGFFTRHGSHGQELDLTVLNEPVEGSPVGTSQDKQPHSWLAAAGCGGARLVYLRQVHGNHVHMAGLVDAQKPPVEADGLVTTEPGLALCVRVADCVPVLLAMMCGDRLAAVAAVHAGWRGMVAGILPIAVGILNEQAGGGAGRMLAAVGPCIGVGRFEVGPEVAQAFDAAGLGQAISPRPSARPHVDLPAAARLQLRRAGLAEDDIDLSGLCTYDQPTDFFSHRRDQGKTGRLGAVIALAQQR